MDLSLELIGLIAYIGIFLLVLIIVFIQCNEKQRKMFSSLIFLFVLIFLIFFVYIPIVQFIFLFLIILDLYFIIYAQILPIFYTRGEGSLFFEKTSEVWEDLKVHQTITQEMEDKKRR